MSKPTFWDRARVLGWLFEVGPPPYLEMSEGAGFCVVTCAPLLTPTPSFLSLLLAQQIGTGAQLFLHGREVPGLLHHHHRFFTRADGRVLHELLNNAVHAHRRPGPVVRGLLLQEEDHLNRMSRHASVAKFL